MAMNDIKHDDVRTAGTANTGSVTDRAADAATAARDEVLRRADDATQVAADTVETRPFGTLAGAIAVGAIVAALIPATERESKAIGPTGKRLRNAAEEALQAARQAGMVELSAAGLTVAAASDGIGGIVGKLAKAVSAAANAAVSSTGSTAETTPASATVPSATPSASTGQYAGQSYEVTPAAV